MAGSRTSSFPSTRHSRALTRATSRRRQTSARGGAPILPSRHAADVERGDPGRHGRGRVADVRRLLHQRPSFRRGLNGDGGNADQHLRTEPDRPDARGGGRDVVDGVPRDPAASLSPKLGAGHARGDTVSVTHASPRTNGGPTPSPSPDGRLVRLRRVRWSRYGLSAIVVAYLTWSLVPVLTAFLFSFNRGYSRSIWQGFSLR